VIKGLGHISRVPVVGIRAMLAIIYLSEGDGREVSESVFMFLKRFRASEYN